MASLLSLIESHLQNAAEDLVAAPYMRNLLETIEYTEASLAADANTAVDQTLEAVPGSPGDALPRALRGVFKPLLPIPDLPAFPEIEIPSGLFPPPSLPPIPPITLPLVMTFRAYRLPQHPLGWEIKLSFPTPLTIDISNDPLKPGKEQKTPDGKQTYVTPITGGADDTITMKIDMPALTITAAKGTDPELDIGSATVSLQPEPISLPFGFGLKLGEFIVSKEGCSFSDPTFYLPRIPSFPLPEISLPTLELSQTTGLRVPRQQIDVPPALGNVIDAIDFEIDRPDARTIRDLWPTSVAFRFPLNGDPVAVGAGKTATVTGDDSAFRLELATTSTGFTLNGELIAATNDANLATISGTDSSRVVLAGLLGPYFPDNNSGFAGLLTTIAFADQVIELGSDAQIAFHSVRLRAEVDAGHPTVSELDVSFDYDVSVKLQASDSTTGFRVWTNTPIQIQNRNVHLRLDDTISIGNLPRPTWSNAQTTIVSYGDWQLAGIPPEIIRIANVVMQQGSLAVELDLRSSLDMGVISIDQASVRVDLGSNISVSVPKFGVSVDMPGILTGNGQLAFSNGRIDAALAVELSKIGVAGRGALAFSAADSFFKLGIEVRLPAPIPFANSGLGLYEIGGLLAINAERQLSNPGESDPILRELSWDPMAAGSIVPGSNVFIGFGAAIGTVPDLGFSLMSKGTILIGVPDPLLRVTLAAELMRGLGGTMHGVVVVDKHELTVALRGAYNIPHLLEVEIPAGAHFPFIDLSKWESRIGGDRADGRGEPASVLFLPDFLDVRAWAFLMAFGNADTVIGASFLDNGIKAYGLSLAVGAGFEVHWSAGPFRFDASAGFLAVLTSRPSNKDDESRPWILAGKAKLAGSVDLGPLSISASASLDVLFDTGSGVFFGKARACASVDLWITTISGCVSFEIGNPPTISIPAPKSPLFGVTLTDRLGAVVAEVTPDNPPPTVWADTVPVLTFTHPVQLADDFLWQGKPGKTVNANILPSDDGWVGTKKLRYQFFLKSVTVTETSPSGKAALLESDWELAWQLPRHKSVLGLIHEVAEASTLALNSIDPYHTSGSAIDADDTTAPGDPIKFVKDLCLPPPEPGDIVFAGEDATLPIDEPMSVPVREGDVTEGDPSQLTFDAILAGGQVIDLPVTPEIVFGIPPIALDDIGIAPLPIPPYTLPEGMEFYQYLRLLHVPDEDTNNYMEQRIVLDNPARNGRLYYIKRRRDETVFVTNDNTGDWRIDFIDTIDDQDDGCDLFLATSPEGIAFSTITLRSWGPVGFAALYVLGEAAVNRNEKNKKARKDTHDKQEDDQTTPVTRSMLKPGYRYKIDVKLSWKGEGEGFTPNKVAETAFSAVHSFTFVVANKASKRLWEMVPPASPPPATAGIALSTSFADAFVNNSHYLEAARISPIHAVKYDESVLAKADLERYVSGITPANATIDYYYGDPIQADFVVDYLPDLATVYDSKIVVAVRCTRDSRLDPVPATPAYDLAQSLIGNPEQFVAPVLTAGLGPLGRRRHKLAATPGAMPPGCKARYPGAGVRSSVQLRPGCDYRATVNVLDKDTPVVPSALTPESEISGGWFRTSRYRNPTDQLRSLGFGTSIYALGRRTAMPILESNANLFSMTDAQLAAITFGEASAMLGLDGYPAPTEPQMSGLWTETAESGRRFAGVLLESIEPLERPGRLQLSQIQVNGSAPRCVIWDERKTRAFLICQPVPMVTAPVIAITAQDTPPGATTSSIAFSAELPLFAGLTGVWNEH